MNFNISKYTIITLIIFTIFIISVANAFKYIPQETNYKHHTQSLKTNTIEANDEIKSKNFVEEDASEDVEEYTDDNYDNDETEEDEIIEIESEPDSGTIIFNNKPYEELSDKDIKELTQ